MVRLVDVARAAGVSVATVSRTLNGNARVDPELAARVHAAVAELDYRPNLVARNLRRRATQAWALVVTDVTNPFCTAVARGVEDVANAAGYSVFLCNSDEDPGKEQRYLAVAEAERVAGLIITPASPASDVGRLLGAGIPVVALDRHLPQPVATVVADSAAGAATATEHLLAHGWRRPACVTGPAGAETADQRAAAFRAVVRRCGLAELVEHVPYHAAGGAAAAARLLDLPQPPDCLFVANSALAIGVLEELRRRGLRLGADLGLVTFDDAPWAPLMDPPITVVAQPAYEMGGRAAELLLAALGSPAEPATRGTAVFEPRLVERGSCLRSG
ncbi:LacI family DNA-binding transcriptional regulator [Auraticoccus sp. F435]|uniref:LacI family DNA-binding transcriptional regulator n=1 Tax=Auraticoccus cholistanensis TaxID=2656650 RepID=A0A6A9UYZ3_9ACTN|nr:LacI family DNA-binding transcriptional regulator [Auraticoccus cholistanensis]MVA77104.1 LacI family DNA-binding transcriptional regulator [Auraticoccus cholistanensis]